MGHNLGNYPQVMHRVTLGENRAIPGENRAIPGETGLFLEVGAEGDRAPAGTWCSRGRPVGWVERSDTHLLLAALLNASDEKIERALED